MVQESFKNIECKTIIELNNSHDQEQQNTKNMEGIPYLTTKDN